MIEGLRFHHHGLALADDGDALIFVDRLGYSPGPVVHDRVQDVRLRLCVHESLPAIEFVMPGDAPGPVSAMLARNSQLLYHTCYEVGDRAAVLESLETANLRVIEVLKPTPAILFDNRLVSFHTVLGFGLIELLESH